MVSVQKMRMKVDVCLKSDQMITCTVELNNKKFLYALNSREERKKLWVDLEYVKEDLPWIVVGEVSGMCRKKLVGKG